MAKKRGKKVLGTIRKGRTKIYSQKQMGFLHAHEIDHTHFKRRGGRIVAKKRHTY